MQSSRATKGIDMTEHRFRVEQADTYEQYIMNVGRGVSEMLATLADKHGIPIEDLYLGLLTESFNTLIMSGHIDGAEGVVFFFAERIAQIKSGEF